MYVHPSACVCVCVRAACVCVHACMPAHTYMYVYARVPGWAIRTTIVHSLIPGHQTFSDFFYLMKFCEETVLRN